VKASVTAEPYFPPMGYLLIRLVSPASLVTLEPVTARGYMEGVTYLPVPRGMLVRETVEETG